MEEYIRMRKIKVYSERLLHEMMRFVWDAQGRARAKSGAHDDLIMSFAITCWLRDTAVEEDVKKKHMDIAILNAISIRGRKMDMSLEASAGWSVGPDIQRKSNLQKEREKMEQYKWLYDPVYKR